MEFFFFFSFSLLLCRELGEGEIGIGKYKQRTRVGDRVGMRFGGTHTCNLGPITKFVNSGLKMFASSRPFLGSV